VPASLYPVARGAQSPTDFWVSAGYIVEPNFDLHLVAGFRVWNGRVLQPFQVHEESLSFAIQLNHLAMHLFRCPDATPTFKLATRLVDHDCPAVPVWLTEHTQFPERSLPAFPNFASFRDVLEVTARPAKYSMIKPAPRQAQGARPLIPRLRSVTNTTASRIASKPH